MGGVKLKDKLDYNRKISYYTGLNNHFSGNAPQAIRDYYYMPTWENEAKWKKIYDHEKGKIMGRHYPNYKEMRDACYELVNSDKRFESCSEVHGWCNNCVWGNTWS